MQQSRVSTQPRPIGVIRSLVSNGRRQSDAVSRLSPPAKNVNMPNIATVRNSEIARVARKEVRAEVETLERVSIRHRAAIAALRRQVDALQKE